MALPAKKGMFHMPKANKNDDLMKENDASAAPEERTAEIPEAPADNKPPEGAPAKVPERVDIFIPRAGVNEEPMLTVGINGVMYRLPSAMVLHSGVSPTHRPVPVGVQVSL